MDQLKDTVEQLDREIAKKRHTEVVERQDALVGLTATVAESVSEIKPTIESMNAMIQGVMESQDDKLDKLLLAQQETIQGMVDEINDIEITVPEVKVNIPKIETPIIPPIVMPSFPAYPAWPDIKLPDINVPEPKVTVNFDATQIKVPDVIMPDEMNVKGWVNLMGVDLDHPLPVQLRDATGKPLNLFDGLTQVLQGGGGGGKSDFFTIKAFGQSAFSVPVNSDGEVKVAGVFTAAAPASSYVIAGNAEGTAYNSDNPLPVYITSGAGGSTAAALIDSGGVQYSGSNPLPVYLTSGASATSASNIVDSSGVAYTGSNPVPVTIVSGGSATTGAQLLNADGTYRDTLPVSGTVTVGSVTSTIGAYVLDSEGNYRDTFPISGSVTASGTVAVSGVTGSIGATILNGEGLARDSWIVSDVTASLKVALIDSTGIQYSGSNPVPVSQITGFATSANQLPDGHNVTVDNASIAVTGTFYQATQPISGTVLVSDVTASLKSALIDSSGVQYSGSNPVPVAGTVIVSSVTASTASSLVDSTGVQYSGSNPVPINGDVDVLTLPFDSRTSTAVDATASGDTTIVSITNSPRLYYVSLSANGANSADVTVIVRIGATAKYKVSLKAGAIWAHHVGAGRSYITGSSGDDIIVNLSAAQTVHVSVEYADV